MNTVTAFGEEPVKFIKTTFPFLLYLLACLLYFLLFIIIAELVIIFNFANLFLSELLNLFLKLRSFGAQVRNNKELVLFIRMRDKLLTFLTHLNIIHLHIYRVIELFIYFRQPTGIILQIKRFCFLNYPLIRWHLHHLAILLVFRESPLCPVKSQPGLLFVPFVQVLLGISNKLGYKLLLSIN